MVGKNVLWVARQHGHSTITMLRTYAAWTEGAVEADVAGIERSMMLTRPQPLRRSVQEFKRSEQSTRENISRPRENLAAVLSAAATVRQLCTPFFYEDGASDSPLNHCSVARDSTEERVGWGGRIRTYVWRDQN